MAHNASDSVRYYVAVKRAHIDDLAKLRQWNNLKVGFEEDTIWIRDFDYAQIHSITVKSIPFKSVYYEKDNKLILINNFLPDRVLPSLLWTSIDRALTVNLPSLNHNFFNIEEKVSIRLITTDNEAEAVAMITNRQMLKNYISEAPIIRLQKIYWSILDLDEVILLGTPLLPLPGKVFWQRNDFLLPTGIDFDLHLLTTVLNKIINPGNNHFVIWNDDGTYSLLPKENLVQLSRSSFQLSDFQP
jgi:hypothetical protein